MLFKVLFVDDTKDNYTDLLEAFQVYNSTEKKTNIKIQCDYARLPEDIPTILEEHYYDLILSDVSFPEYDNPDFERNRLSDVIKYVNIWSKDNNGERSIPIIAYTGKGKSVLDECLKEKDSLFDIWDRNSAGNDYVAWRISQVALEIASIRPDSMLQRLIRDIDTSKEYIDINQRVEWYEHVNNMAVAYNAGWTEFDQIEGATASIDRIADSLNTWEVCSNYWHIMREWEFLGRAVSRRARGHARHVINVFWIGYLLLNNRYINEWFTSRYSDLIDSRNNMNSVKYEHPTKSFCNIWYYSALFHDIGICLQKSKNVTEHRNSLFHKYGNYVNDILTPESFDFGNICSIGTEFLTRNFKKTISDKLISLWTKSCEDKAPDHGIISALTIISDIKDKKQECYARESARAMVLHNLIRDLNIDNQDLTWSDESIACLLILCDQLQTWDRETPEKKNPDIYGPERAELSNLIIEQNNDEHIMIYMDINYLMPADLRHAGKLYIQSIEEFETILRKYPKKALLKLGKDWPFRLKVSCFVDNNPIDINMDFPLE